MACEYVDSDDILIDAIIAGVAHVAQESAGTTTWPSLILSKTLDIGRQYELSQRELKLLRGSEEIPVSKLGVKQKRSGIERRDKMTRMDPLQKTSAKETRCGKHVNQIKCPAVGTICKYWKKPDHWLSVCRKCDRAAARMKSRKVYPIKIPSWHSLIYHQWSRHSCMQVR